MAWTTAVAIIVLLIYMLKNKEQHQARLMTEEDIFKSFDRKYWEYRADSPIKLKDNAEAYIRYNGEVCAMRIADYGMWEFQYKDNYKQLSPHKEYPYQAYKCIRFCIYEGFVYVFHVWGDIVVLNPHLKLYNTDRRKLVMFYKDFIASSPTVWEERIRIKAFKFDVEPKVFLYKDNAYFEENLQDAWHHLKN